MPRMKGQNGFSNFVRGTLYAAIYTTFKIKFNLLHLLIYSLFLLITFSYSLIGM